jgi:hypothetical protein
MHGVYILGITIMPVDSHKKAAQHHETAAAEHKAAADLHE